MSLPKHQHFASLVILVLLALIGCGFGLSSPSNGDDSPYTDKVIVQFESEPLAYRFGPSHAEEEQQLRKRRNLEDFELHAPDRFARMIERNVEARQHLERMNDEHTAFLAALANRFELTSTVERNSANAVDEAVKSFVTRTYSHDGQPTEDIFTVVINGMSLRIPEQYMDQPQQFMDILRTLPSVKSVTRERRLIPALFSSGQAINLNAAYSSPRIGNVSMAGKGIKIASLDDGVYSAAKMFSGQGFSYPTGWTPAQMGDVNNCNGKVITSRSFIGAPSDPGADGESHGTFSASIAGGVVVNATRDSFASVIHGVAPQAWIMNYRMLGDGGGEVSAINALQAALQDGADVLINSWAVPGYTYDGGAFSPVDKALVSVARAGRFVTMAAGNEGPLLSTVIHAEPDYITVGATTKASFLNTTSETIQSSDAYHMSEQSSRGPSMLRTLKPDITAPGENIFAQGYEKEKTGNAGFGVQSGTSFACPMVAGAAALMKQIHPEWTAKQIKAALMASARWKDVMVDATTKAQPLDMGAGNLDLQRAIDPGALLDPPSLSYGYMDKGTKKTIEVTVTNVASSQQTFSIKSVYTGPGSEPDYTSTVLGISIEPTSLVLAAGASGKMNITFDSSITGVEAGDRQGFIVLESGPYEAHMPLWARVLTPASVPVLILNATASATSASILDMYTSALTALGLNSTIYDIISTPLKANDQYWISSYQMVFVVFGNNGIVGGRTTIDDMTREILREYVVMGGKIFVNGALSAYALRDFIPPIELNNLINFLYNSTLPINTANTCPSPDLPTSTVSGPANAPKTFQQLSFTLLDTPGSRCLSALEAEADARRPRETLTLMSSNGNLLVGGKRAQPTMQDPGRRFTFASVTSVLSLEMIPEASRLPFIAAVVGYLMEDVNINLNVVPRLSNNNPGLELRLSLASSLSDSMRAPFAGQPSFVPTYTVSFGDGKSSRTINGAVAVNTASDLTYCYQRAGLYNVTVEAISTFGTGAIMQTQVNATNACGSAASLTSPLSFLFMWLRSVILA